MFGIDKVFQAQLEITQDLNKRVIDLEESIIRINELLIELVDIVKEMNEEVVNGN